MAFGHILNAMERVARRDMLLGAQPKEDVEDTHSHIHVDSACQGNPQQYYRINYWLVAGGVMLHRVSREGGRSMSTAEGCNIPNTHYMYMVEAGLCHSCTYIPLLCYFVTNPPCTVQITRVTTHTCNNTQPCDDL